MNSADYLHSMFALDGRVAVVTGGQGKLGTEFVRALASAGAKVAVFDKTPDTNEALKQLAAEFSLSFHQVDITNEDEVERAFRAVRDAWSEATILVNNAGKGSSPNNPGNGGVPFAEYPMNVWEEYFLVNATAAAICSKAFGAQLIAAKKPGVIINNLSIYAVMAPDQRIYEFRAAKGLAPFVKDAAYGASKAALLALTRDLAAEWAPHGIRVVAISPGGVEGPKSDPEFVKRYSERVPMGRMATIKDLCGAVVFLASDASSYMTGSNLMIDGGMNAW
jgi:NAD(P)-dependent dehydrogenase (short-subunit alcohol dehydrogenase family)